MLSICSYKGLIVASKELNLEIPRLNLESHSGKREDRICDAEKEERDFLWGLFLLLRSLLGPYLFFRGCRWSFLGPYFIRI